MTHPTHPSDDPEPSVDEVAHDARTLSGRVRETAEPAEPAAYTAADQPLSVSNATHTAGGRVPVVVGSGGHAQDTHADAPATPVADGHAAAAGHGGGHDGAHEEDDLGPVDTAAWGAGLLGTAVGLFMAFCFVLATSGSSPF